VVDTLSRRPTGELAKVLKLKWSELRNDDKVAKVCMVVLAITLKIIMRVVKAHTED